MIELVAVSLYVMAKTMRRDEVTCGGRSRRRGGAHAHLCLRGNLEEKALPKKG